MYTYVDWMKCRLCKQTNCLFYASYEKYGTRKNNPKWAIRMCKLCYLESCKIRNAKHLDRIAGIK